MRAVDRRPLLAGEAGIQIADRVVPTEALLYLSALTNGIFGYVLGNVIAMIDRQQSSKALIGISMAVIFSTQVIGSIAALYLLRGTLSSGERRMYAAVVALSIASGLLKGYHDDCLASIFLKDHNTCKLFG